MDLLDRDSLKDLKEILAEALKQGFSSRSSPIQLKIELLIDLALQIRMDLKMSENLRERLNPDLKTPPGEVDELNNQKMIWLPRSRLFRNKRMDRLIQFFTALAQTLVRLQKDVSWNPFRGIQDSQASQQRTQEYHYWRRRRSPP